MIMGFIDTMRSEGHAVETVCRVLREQGCPVVARTYRAWRGAHRRVAARTISDALIEDAVRSAAWSTDETGARRLTPEGVVAELADRGVVAQRASGAPVAGSRRNRPVRSGH